MPLRISRLVAIVTVTLVLGAGTAMASTDRVDSGTAAAVTATTENAFFPDDTSVNITDCVSALPRPECGSRERGGWRQGAVFAAVIVGLVAIGVRLVVGVRRRDHPGHTAADDT